MRARLCLLVLAGVFLFACRPSLSQGLNPAESQAGATPTATPAPPVLSQGQELSEELKPLLLTPEDLPVEASYYLPEPGASSPFHNTEVVAAWGGLPGWEYLQATGRVDGYYADYLRGSEFASVPQEFFCNVTVFTTPEGARLSLTDYNLVAIADPGDESWSYVESPGLELGDLYLILTLREAQADGEDLVWYRIEFSYQNLVGVVAGYGPEDKVTPKFMEEAARALLVKIEASPFVQP